LGLRDGQFIAPFAGIEIAGLCLRAIQARGRFLLRTCSLSASMLNSGASRPPV
jgi:hypothetical protein